MALAQNDYFAKFGFIYSVTQLSFAVKLFIIFYLNSSFMTFISFLLAMLLVIIVRYVASCCSPSNLSFQNSCFCVLIINYTFRNGFSAQCPFHLFLGVWFRLDQIALCGLGNIFRLDCGEINPFYMCVVCVDKDLDLGKVG